MSKHHNNLVILFFPKSSNEDLFKIIHSLKFDYTYDIKTHNTGEPLDDFEINHDKIVLIIHGDNDLDFEEIHKDIEKYKIDMSSFESVVLSSIKDCSPWMVSFRAEICTNINDIENATKDLKKVMNRAFRELHRMDSNHEVQHFGEALETL
jgi:hypothetical protein